MFYIVEFYGNKGWEIYSETKSQNKALRDFRMLKNEGCARITFFDRGGDSS